MNPGLRRLLALMVVFTLTFGLVAGLRLSREGGFQAWLARLRGTSTSQQFVPENFTLPEKAPLNLGDVELLSRLNSEYAKLTEAVVPSVVSINTAGMRTEQRRDMTGRSRLLSYPTQGQGSGVIVTEEGHVVTNHHVVAGQQEIHVMLHGGKSLSAHLIGDDPLLDIAVLKLDAPNGEKFSPLKFGDSDQVKVGQLVFAVGNPFGLGETVTQGIISAKERSLSDTQRDLFQTDAAINPGNSGGPLVNLRGEIIGINASIYSSDKQNPGFQGVGFSIPANEVKDTMFQILQRGRPVRGYLGLQLRDVDAVVRSALQYKGTTGVTVMGVLPGSPAELAGLQPWDVITKFQGEEIRASQQLINLVQRAKVGQTVEFVIWRKGSEQTLRAKIAESGKPETSSSSDRGPRGPQQVLETIGIQVRELANVERARGMSGVVVTNLSDDALARPLVQPGDLVVAVNQNPIGNTQEFFIYLSSSATSQESSLVLIRKGKPVSVNLPRVELR